MIILVDDEERENEGDLVFAAECATPEKINLMAVEGRGLVCVPADGERLARLDLFPPPLEENTALMGTNFTQSVDARSGVTTGISAADRCQTALVLANPKAGPRTWCGRGTSFPWRRAKAASCAAPATPRGPSTCAGWPVSNRSASSAKS